MVFTGSPSKVVWIGDDSTLIPPNGLDVDARYIRVHV